MKEKYHLSKTEAEIMEMLWEQDGPIRQTELLAMFCDSGKDWGRQTLNTLLMRLEARGIVERAKRMVWASHDRQGYGLLIIQETLDAFFDGKLENMLREYEKSRGKEE